MRWPRSFRAKNRRRCELIDKDIDEGLNPGETKDLERLQREVGEWVAARFGRDESTLDDMQKRIELLGEKLKIGGVG